MSEDQARIAQSIQAARAFLVDHPDKAFGTDTEARARLVEGLKVHVEGPHGWALETDMSTGVGGTGSAPSPGWLLRAAVASCDAVLIAMVCAEEGVRVTHLEAAVTSESDDRGLLGAADVPPGPQSVALRVRMTAEGRSAAELNALVERALKRSPVSEALTRRVPVEVTVDIAG